mmetsp:Transcript_23803/g.46638  ORF Transcript_23803/g.46638 Transcript_23803/m.46638 type:complete len:209 (-) Transcript_23803:555-1181(-)
MSRKHPFEAVPSQLVHGLDLLLPRVETKSWIGTEMLVVCRSRKGHVVTSEQEFVFVQEGTGPDCVSGHRDDLEITGQFVVILTIEGLLDRVAESRIPWKVPDMHHTFTIEVLREFLVIADVIDVREEHVLHPAEGFQTLGESWRKTRGVDQDVAFRPANQIACRSKGFLGVVAAVVHPFSCIDGVGKGFMSLLDVLWSTFRSNRRGGT